MKKLLQIAEDAIDAADEYICLKVKEDLRPETEEEEEKLILKIWENVEKKILERR